MVPSLPALRMQPSVPVTVRSKGNDHVLRSIALGALGTGSGIGWFGVRVQPFDDLPLHPTATMSVHVASVKRGNLGPARPGCIKKTV